MRLGLIVLVALLGGCSREPDFAERYDAASKEIGTSAKQIDEELVKRADAAGSTMKEEPPSSGTGPSPSVEP